MMGGDISNITIQKNDMLEEADSTKTKTKKIPIYQ
jgi:hypothetical protein